MIGRIIQNYKIVSLLGEGGMGVVYKAYDFKLDRYAAIKLLNPAEVRNPRFVERFKREAKNQAKLSHPNIVSVYGFVEAKDLLGFVMEYIEGRTVEDYLNEYGRLSLNDSIQIMKQVLIGTAYAHSEGFIHRDLKPSNIIIDTKGIVKITDFGIAKSINESMSITRTGTKVGTVLYMSPEQIKGYESTIISDLYSLGITFYEMLNGKVPFDYLNEYDILDAHINSIPAPLSDIYPDIPEGVDMIILRSMNKSPTGNFRDCTDFIYELEIFENNIPSNNQDQYSSKSQIEIHSPVKKTSVGRKIFNSILFIVFISLLLFSFKAVTDYLLEKEKLAQSQESSFEDGSFTYIKTDWDKLKTGSSVDIRSLLVSKNGRILIFGDNGFIALSSDDGATFRRVNSGTVKNLYSSVRLGEEKIVAVGEEGTILRSNDNGVSWRNSDSDTDQSLFSVKVFNNILYSVGSKGTIIISSDYGNSWKKIPAPTEKIVYDLYFTTPDKGLIVGWNGLIMQTVDGGKSWSSFPSRTDNYLRSVDFIDPRNGIIVGGEGTILRTTDSGISWNNISSGTISSFNKILFENELGFALSNRGEIIISSDKGLNWELNFTGYYSILSDIDINAEGKLLVSGGNGTLLKSK